MGLARFQVDCSDPLRPTLSIEDEPYDMSTVQRMSVDFQAQNVPRIFLELNAGEGVLEGEGVVVQQVPVPADALAILDDFFSAIDPAELEQAILGEFGAFSDTTTGEACIAVMKKWIRRG